MPPELLPPPPGDAAPAPVPSAEIVEGVLPSGQVHLFSGASGAGKTTVLAQLVAAIQRGEPFFGHATNQPAEIAFVAADRRWSDHQLWFDTAGCQPFNHYSLVDDKSLTGEMIRNRVRKEGSMWLFNYVVERLWGKSGPPPGTFLIPDPGVLFYGGDIIPYIPVFTHGLDLNKWAAKHESTILSTAHAGKQKGDKGQRYARPQDRIAGTTAQTATAGTTVHLATPVETETGFSELTWIPHHAPSETVVLERDKATGLFRIAPMPAQEAADEDSSEPQQARAHLLLPFIPFEPLEISRKDLLTTTSLSPRTLKRYIDDLVDHGVIRVSRFGHWSRPNKQDGSPSA